MMTEMRMTMMMMLMTMMMMMMMMVVVVVVVMSVYLASITGVDAIMEACSRLATNPARRKSLARFGFDRLDRKFIVAHLSLT